MLANGDKFYRSCFSWYYKKMNEELAMQHSVQNQLQPEPAKNPWPKRILMTFVFLILIGGIGYGTAYAWRQYTDVKNELASEQAKTKDLKAKNSELQKKTTAEPTAPQVSETLADGKTISYGLTLDSAQIVFWNQAGSVSISDKRVLSYISSVDGALLTSVCGLSDNIFNQTNVSMGMLDTAKKEFVKNQTPNCLELLASPDKNKDTTSQTAAKAVLDKVNENITQFIQSATIQ